LSCPRDGLEPTKEIRRSAGVELGWEAFGPRDEGRWPRFIRKKSTLNPQL